MFAYVVSGRMVSQNFVMIAHNNYVTEIQNAEDITHIAVFLTGTELFCPNYAALIYFSLPSVDSEPKWQLLGYLSNDKPSSVFKVSGIQRKHVVDTVFEGYIAQDTFSTTARIGIAIDSVEVVQQHISTLENLKPNTVAVTGFVNKMLEHFFNYALSFGRSPAQIPPNENETYIPLSVLQSWYDSFNRRLAINPNFWKML